MLNVIYYMYKVVKLKGVEYGGYTRNLDTLDNALYG